MPLWQTIDTTERIWIDQFDKPYQNTTPLRIFNFESTCNRKDFEPHMCTNGWIGCVLVWDHLVLRRARQLGLTPACLQYHSRYWRKKWKHCHLRWRRLYQQLFPMDGWSRNSCYFLAVFVSYFADTSCGYQTSLAGFSTLEDETDLSADAQHRYITFVLTYFLKKEWDNVVAIIANLIS